MSSGYIRFLRRNYHKWTNWSNAPDACKRSRHPLILPFCILFCISDETNLLLINFSNCRLWISKIFPQLRNTLTFTLMSARYDSPQAFLSVRRGLSVGWRLAWSDRPRTNVSDFVLPLGTQCCTRWWSLWEKRFKLFISHKSSQFQWILDQCAKLDSSLSQAATMLHRHEVNVKRLHFLWTVPSDWVAKNEERKMAFEILSWRKI